MDGGSSSKVAHPRFAGILSTSVWCTPDSGPDDRIALSSSCFSA